MVRASGDAGALTNKLVLTKDDPLGDVAFGIDNTFASRAIDEGVFAPYAAKLPGGRRAVRARRATTTTTLTPIDNGNVCVNVDDTWFADHDLAPPTDPRRPGRSRRTRTCSSPPARRPARRAWRSCSPTIAAYGDELAGLLDAS